MRLLWGSPFNNRSAIGHFSAGICAELSSRGHEVYILPLDATDVPYSQIVSDLSVLPRSSATFPEIDMAIINYGNHAPYHAGALELAVAQTHLAIFHDIEMRHFAAGMKALFGVQIPRLSGSGPDLRAEEFDLVPPEGRAVLQSLASMACGAIVHGPHYLPSIQEVCAGQTKMIPLYVPFGDASDPKPRAPGALRVCIVGVANPHKQPDRVIRAMASLISKWGPIELHLAGEVSEDQILSLAGLCDELQLPHPKFHGYLTDARMSEIVGQADVICNLRYPVTEGGSGSLITSLYHARPVIVSDIASYSLVPDEAVVKISYGENVGDLASALDGVFSDPGFSERRALNGRAWARRQANAKSYVDSFEDLLSEAVQLAPIFDVCRTLTPEVCYPGGGVMMSALKRTAESIDELYLS